MSTADTIAAGPRRVKGRQAAKGRLAGVRVKGDAVPAGRTAAIVLASEGRAFTPASIALAGDLAKESDGTVLVVSIARVHGVSFGLPNPGLMPTREEWDAQWEIVKHAVTRLRRRGLTAEGQVFGTRKPAQRICALATEVVAEGIVMGADESKGWLIGGMMWSQEPQAVQRRAAIPVHLVT